MMKQQRYETKSEYNARRALNITALLAIRAIEATSIRREQIFAQIDRINDAYVYPICEMIRIRC